MKQLKIALIGCGEWGKNILRDLKLLNCEVAVVCQSKTSFDYAKQYAADAIFTTISALPNVDGFIIATPASTHTAVIKQILHCNKPIFVEKPLTINRAEAKFLIDIFADNIFVMHKWRYHPGIQMLAKIAAQKELGEVIGIHSSRFNLKNQHDDVDMIWTCLPHDLTISLEILGYLLTPSKATAVEWNNATVELNAILGEKPWHLLEISCIRSTALREVRLICEDGIAILKDADANYIEINRRDHQALNRMQIEKKYFANTQPLFEELRIFTNYLKGGAKPKTDAKEGYLIVDAISKLRQLANVKHSGVLQNAHYYQGETNAETII